MGQFIATNDQRITIIRVGEQHISANMNTQIATITEVSDFESESAVGADFILDFGCGRPKAIVVITSATVSN